MHRVEIQLAGARGWLVIRPALQTLRMAGVNNGLVCHDSLPFVFVCRCLLRQAFNVFGQASCPYRLAAQLCHLLLSLVTLMAANPSPISSLFFNRLCQLFDAAPEFCNVRTVDRLWRLLWPGRCCDWLSFTNSHS